MNINLEKTGDLTAEVTVNVEPKDYKVQVRNELKKYAKDLKIPGFRPGKVPIGMVRKMAGIGLVIEEVQKVVNDNLNTYFSEEKINVLGDPLPLETKTEEDFDINCEKELDFKFELGIAPEFELDFKFDGIPTKYDIEVDDAYLQEEIEKLQDRFSEVEQPETVERGDMLFGKLFEAGAEDKEEGEGEEGEEEGFSQMISLNPERIGKDSLFDEMIGKNVDEVVDFDVFAIAETNEEIANLTFIDKEDLEEIVGKSLRFEIKRINRTTKAEMNEEFFDKVGQNFGWEKEEGKEEEAWDEASFKEKLGEAHKGEMKELESQRFSNDMYTALLDHYQDLAFPDEFLKKWMGAINQGKSPEQVEEEFPDFKRSLVWSLIIEKLQKANEELNVTPEEVTESIRGFVQQSLAYSGQSVSQQQESEYLMRMLQNKEIVNQHYSRISTGKIFPHIEEQADPAREAITATEFFKMVEAEREEEERKQKEKEEELAKQAEEAEASNPETVSETAEQEESSDS
ncbi:MAG: trigger factor [Bacteroidota bacterium]